MVTEPLLGIIDLFDSILLNAKSRKILNLQANILFRNINYILCNKQCNDNV